MSSTEYIDYVSTITKRAEYANSAVKQLFHRLEHDSKQLPKLDYAIFQILRGETKRYMKEISYSELATMFRTCRTALEALLQEHQAHYGDEFSPEKYLTPELVIYQQVNNSGEKILFDRLCEMCLEHGKELERFDEGIWLEIDERFYTFTLDSLEVTDLEENPIQESFSLTAMSICNSDYSNDLIDFVMEQLRDKSLMYF